MFFVGTMYYKPNREAATFLAREVFPLVRREIPEATCHLAGKTDASDYSGLNHPEQGVHMHGSLEDIRPLFAQAQILVVLFSSAAERASRSWKRWRRARPSCPARSRRRALITLTADTAAELATSVVSLLRDRERCFRIGQAGRRLVEQKYSWDAGADVMRTEILRALEKKAKPDTQ